MSAVFNLTNIIPASLFRADSGAASLQKLLALGLPSLSESYSENELMIRGPARRCFLDTFFFQQLLAGSIASYLDIQPNFR